MAQYPLGIKNMLRTAHLKQIGNIHNGMGMIDFIIYIFLKDIFSITLNNCNNFSDDCANIITIMNYLVQRGCIFKATNKLVDV